MRLSYPKSVMMATAQQVLQPATDAPPLLPTCEASSAVSSVAHCDHHHHHGHVHFSDSAMKALGMGELSVGEVIRNGIFSCLLIVLAAQIAVGVLYNLLKLGKRKVVFFEVAIMSMGVGTLVADAMMHILPDAFLMENTNVVGLGFSAIAGMLSVIVIEAVVHGIQDLYPGTVGKAQYNLQSECSGLKETKGKVEDDHSHQCDHSHECDHCEDSTDASHDTKEEGHVSETRGSMMVSPVAPQESSCSNHHHNHDDDHHHGGGHCDHGHCHHGLTHLVEEVENLHTGRKEAVLAASLANLIANSCHNIIDGLSIGIAFNDSWKTGVATSLCILIHEVPIQLSTFILLLRANFKVQTAFLLNALVSLSVVLGVFATTFVKSTTVLAHLLMATAGNFLCLAFFQMLTEIRSTVSDRELSKSQRRRVGCVGLLSGAVGVAIIAILAVKEGH